MWIAKDIGSYPTSITFKLATAINDDGEGGTATGTEDLVVPVRLTPVSGQGEAAQIIEQNFPGASNYQYVFYGWINDRTNYKFPASLRKQRRPIGTCTIEVGEGRIECSVSGVVLEIAAKKIGEKFTAIWTEI